MIYAVIDTNVWVSSLLTHNDSSPTERIFRLLFKGEIVALYNDEIMAEYEDVLLARDSASLKKMLTSCWIISRRMVFTRTEPLSTKPCPTKMTEFFLRCLSLGRIHSWLRVTWSIIQNCQKSLRQLNSSPSILVNRDHGDRYRWFAEREEWWMSD